MFVMGCRSMADRSTVNREVAGSNPAAPVLSRMLACPEVAIEVLKRDWAGIDRVDSADLNSLIWLSSSIRDRTLNDILIGVARSPKKAALIRKAASHAGYSSNIWSGFNL